MDGVVKLNVATDDICTDKPTAWEKKACTALEAFVSAHALPGPPATQLSAIKKLKDLFTRWLGTVMTPAPPFHMFLSGSYKMNVYSHHADIDVVVVTTNSISRTQVFAGFVAMLEADDSVTDITPIPNARVPIICCTMDGQEFDIMTCHLRSFELPPRRSMIGTYVWMNGLDESSILAFNGPRVTEILLAALPRPWHFQTAVRFLRVWAKQRAMYSNKSGYLGGINIVLLVAHTALRNVNANAHGLISKTIATFVKWDWAGRKHLKFIDEENSSPCPVWLKKFDVQIKDRDSPIVLLTPCYPRFNTMHAASEHSFRVMLAEFQRAHGLLQSMESLNEPSFEALAAALPLAGMCSRFLRVSISVPLQSGAAWQGFIESQVRFLVKYLSMEELAIASFRFLPLWVDTVTDTHRVREAYVTADDDRKIRTYAVKGDIQRAFRHFITEHAEKGPPQPRDCTMTLGFVSAEDVPMHLLSANMMHFERKVTYALPPPIVKLPTALGDSKPESTAAKPVRVLGARPPPPPFLPPVVRKLRFVPAAPRVPAVTARTTTLIRIRRLQGQCVTAFDVYIGPEWRRGGWNFPASECLRSGAPLPTAFSTKQLWVVAYETFVRKKMATDRRFRRFIQSLQGKVLGCWCTDVCHGHALLRILAEIK
jgi:hypothetical protein